MPPIRTSTISRRTTAGVVRAAATASSLLAMLGRSGRRRAAAAVDAAALLGAVVYAAALPSTWRRTTRDVLARQLLFTSVDGASTAARIGAAVGVLMIVQAALWLDAFGADPEMVAPLFLRLSVRELGPLLASLIVIGRSGAAISAELATMKVNEELEVLESQGIDVMTYLVAPRVIGVIISVFSLALLVVCSMLAGGYLVGALVRAIRTSADQFLADLLRQADFVDLLFFLSKTIVVGLFVGTICCTAGLRVRRAATDIPRVAARSGVQALSGVFIVSAALSLIIYGRVLIFQVL